MDRGVVEMSGGVGESTSRSTKVSVRKMQDPPSAIEVVAETEIGMHNRFSLPPGQSWCDQITRDHDPRRADQCNLHTHVIANNNKSPIEKTTTTAT